MKVPKLRFKGFEGDWQKFKIKDICINKWTWTLTKDKVASEYWYPVINWWVSNYWYYFDYNNENAITISSRWENAGYAKYNKWKFRAWWLCYVYESQKHNTQFIGILLNGKEKHIKSTMIARTTIPALNKSEFNEYFITIPEKQKEQEKIWAFFEKLDTQITQQSQKLEKLKNMKQSFLQKLFPKDWSALPELRFKGFEGDWQKFKIKDICINKWTWTLTKDKVASEYWYPVINWWVSNYWYYFDYNNENAITISSRWENAGYAKYNKWKFRAWWLCYVYESQKHNTQFIGILLNGKEKHIKSTMIARTTIPALNKSEFNEYFITIPEKQKEQEKIWAFFEKLDTQITQQSQKLEKLKNMKQSLLEKMFI